MPVDIGQSGDISFGVAVSSDNLDDISQYHKHVPYNLEIL
jgi:hypothetical protein